MHLIHQKYRPDIDGLRALAILPVIAYHAFPGFMSGGFIGVDIFFVISGYLISTIIFSSLEHNRFSLLEFYIRRIRRILPALLTVLLATLFCAWFLLLPSEFEDIGQHTFASAAFFQNILLWREVGYFDDPASLKPLLHLWSLAVEEQFYIIWPLLLAFAWKRRWKFILITSIIACASFLYNIYLSSYNSTAAFYLPFPRFWELMAGGILAYINLHRPGMLSRYRNTRSLAGTAIVMAAIFLMHDRLTFPGWLALLPVAGTVLIISSGGNAWINLKLLSNRVVTGIGKISYPLYLWHWPLLSFTYIINPYPSRTVLFAIVVTAFILSILTYFYVENPLRSRGNRKIVATALMALLVVEAGSGVYVRENSDIARIYNESHELLSKERKAQFQSSRNSDGSCEKLNNISPVKSETCLSNSSQPEVMFIGDSHAMALYSSVHSGDIQLNAILIAAHSCPMFPNLDHKPVPNQPWRDNCKRVARHAIYIAKKLKSIRTVLIINNEGTAYEPITYFKDKHIVTGKAAFVSGFGSLIATMKSLNKNVVFIKDTPWLKHRPEHCINRLPYFVENRCDITLNEMKTRPERIFYEQSVELLTKYFPGLNVYDTVSTLCKNDVCRPEENGEWVYHDTNHLSIYGSSVVLNDMLNKGYF